MTTATASILDRSFKDVWLISAGHGLTHWYTATFYILLPLIGKELGLSYTEIGVIMTVQHLAGAISNIPGGIIVDNIGKKGYLMAASLFWIGLPYALMSVTHNYWMLLVCVTLVGIGNNLWHPAAIPTLAHQFPQRKGLVLSIHGMGGNIGEALAPFVVGGLLAWFSWRTVVVMNVVPGVFMAVMILMLVGALSMATGREKHVNDAGEKQNVREYMKNFLGLLKNRDLMLISVSGAFRTMTQVGLLTFLPVYLAYQLEYSPFAVGICMTVLQIGGFLAGPIGGHLSDKMGRKSIVTGSMLLSGVMIIGMALAGRSALFIVFIALVGFFLYATRPVFQAWAVERTPKHLAGAGVGLQFCILAIGGGIAPALAGMVADAYDIYTVFYFLGGIIILSNVLVFFLPNSEPSPAAGGARAS